MFEDQCVFCHIANGRIPAKKVYEDGEVAAVLDINPALDGHILLIPKKHAVVMGQLDDVLVAHMGMVAKQLSQALIRAFKLDGTSVFAQNGPAAGQRAPHFMLHVIPRKEGDGVVLQPKVVRLDPKELEGAYKALGAAVEKVFGRAPPKMEGVKASPAAPEPKKESDNRELKTDNQEPKSESRELRTDKQKLITADQLPTTNDQPQTTNHKPPTSKDKPNLDALTEFLLGGKK